ncbi:MAG: ABC transporter substrate-binding protein, partial [Clostridiales bacterium]
MKKTLLFLMILCFGLFIFTGCEANVQETVVAPKPVKKLDTTLMMYVSDQFETIDPAYVESEMELRMASMVFEGLVKEYDGVIRPALAISWNTSNNDREYTFQLRPDIYFHNGKKMTADDVKFSWERILRLKAPCSYIFSNIVGYENVIDGSDKLLSGVEIISDYQLKVRLKKPQENFLLLLSMPGAMVLDRLELVEHGIDFAKASTPFKEYLLPSGTGPYRFVEWIADQNLVIGSFTEYYGIQSTVDRMEFSFGLNDKDAFVKLAGDHFDCLLDVFPQSSDFNLSANGISLLSRPVRSFSYLVCNPDKEPFTDPKLREGLFNSISANDIIVKVRNGYGISPDGNFLDYWYSLDEGVLSKSRSTQKGKQILQNAGYGVAGGKAMPTLKLDYTLGNEQADEASAIAAALREVGFEVRLEGHTVKQMNDLIANGETSFYLADFNDKGGGLDAFFMEAIDSRWQGVIPAGSWSSDLSRAYNSSLDERKAIFS